MKKILIPLLALTALVSAAQTINNEDIAQEIKQLTEKIEKVETLEKQNVKLNAEIKRLRDTLSAASATIIGLEKEIKANNDAIQQTTEKVSLNASDFSSKISLTETKLSEVDKSLGKTTIWTIIGILAAIVVAGMLYLLLNKKQKIDKASFFEQLSKMKLVMDENLLCEYAKLTELIDAQIKAFEKMKLNPPPAEPDHSLALKVADEITLIERNISHMNPDTKGLKPLIRACERLRDNLLSKGYEFPDLLGKEFIDGMRITVLMSIPDEKLEQGKAVITKIIKPQVDFNEKLIQTAQVELSVGVK